MSLVRYIVGVGLSFVVTFGLFVLMYSLIAREEVSIDETKTKKLADIYMGETKIKDNIKVNKPDKPEEQEEPPPEVDLPEMEDIEVNTAPINIAAPQTDAGGFAGKFGVTASDGEYLPIVKVAPIYPRRAQTRGITGYCIVEYTVNKTGAVLDPVPVDCNPPGVFERASVRAALKFKYKPRVVDGEAIDVPGVQNRFTYTLED